jgi:hypothetical protein
MLTWEQMRWRGEGARQALSLLNLLKNEKIRQYLKTKKSKLFVKELYSLKIAIRQTIIKSNCVAEYCGCRA